MTDNNVAKAETKSDAGAKTVDYYVPLGVRVASSWAWRLVIIGIATAGVVWLLVQVREVLVPLIIALLLTALLRPIVVQLQARKCPKFLAVLVAILVLAIAIAFLTFLSVTQLRASLDNITVRTEQAIHEFNMWLQTRPFGVEPEIATNTIKELQNAIHRPENQTKLLHGALDVASHTAHLFTSFIIIIFSLIFFLLDGRKIWYWALGFLPAKAHAMVDTAAQAGWAAVGRYTRMQIVVASINSVGIGLGTVLLGVPFAVPIAILVFLFSFIPFLGAILSGVFAVLIALLYNGPVAAIMMLIVVILVHQIESHVLQPLIMGNALSIHPLAVVVTVPTALMAAGFVGALFAVPLVACISAMVDAMTAGAGRGKADPLIAYQSALKAKKARKARNRLTVKNAKRK